MKIDRDGLPRFVQELFLDPAVLAAQGRPAVCQKREFLAFRQAPHFPPRQQGPTRVTEFLPLSMKPVCAHCFETSPWHSLMPSTAFAPSSFHTYPAAIKSRTLKGCKMRRLATKDYRVVFAAILLFGSSSRRDAHPCRPCPSDLLRPEPGPGPRLARFAPPPAASGRIEIQRQGEVAMCRCPKQEGLHLATRPRPSRPSGPDPAPAPVPFGRIRGDGAGKGPVPAPRAIKRRNTS